ncbi:hypothetical protein GJ744_004061 [Endocarpon pusillum]|uniref:Uncharacterized protein n=1 Tax=Endocarpon pusillum TaxID=364733 RepID=A0A8H7E076_9EURO|nr:hypothetical protein GJ744_004061 [Endocarpon pusillum]
MLRRLQELYYVIIANNALWVQMRQIPAKIQEAIARTVLWGLIAAVNGELFASQCPYFGSGGGFLRIG